MTACPLCGTEFRPVSRQRFCSDRCRKAAYRRRRQPPAEPIAVPARRPRRPITIYECPDCENRYLGEQRCPDCNVFCNRIGFGGTCPHCDQPVAHNDLTDTVLDAANTPPPRSPRQR